MAGTSTSVEKLARWLGSACLVALGMALTNGCATTNQGAFEKVLAGQSKVVDLSHPIVDGMPAGLDLGSCEVRPASTIASDGLYINTLSLTETAGTNIEAPARVVSSNPPVDQLPFRQFMGYGVVLDVESAAMEKADYQVTRSDIEIWESDHGAIPPEAIVLIRSGWDKRWSEWERYANRDANKQPMFPGISAEAVDFLIRERRVHALGIDTMSLYAGSGNEAGQRAFLLTGKFYINNLTNLDKLPPRGSIVIAIPLRIEGGSGSPARVLAIVPQEKTAVEPGKQKVDHGNDAGFDQSRPGMGY